MKTFTIGKVTKPGLIVPNVIASNITPQFTVHHQYGLHANPNGPAPNVTVNPNGNFNTNASNIVRPAFNSTFRPFLQQSNNASLNFNIIGTNNNVSVKSPILAAQLQTLTQLANPVQTHSNNISSCSNKTATVHYQITQQPINESNILAVKIASPAIVESTTSRSQSPFSYSPQPPKTPSTPSTPRSLTPHQTNSLTNNDQQIRVLTPSEIMRTLPSLPNQDVGCCFDNNSVKNASNNNNNNNQQQQQLNNNQVCSTTIPSSQCVFFY
jgi:hypothetical protein